jgi:hypothetical protein
VEIEVSAALAIELLVELGQANDYHRKQQPAIETLRGLLKESLLGKPDKAAPDKAP